MTETLPAIPQTKDVIQTLPSATLYVLEQAGAIAREILDERVVTWTQEGWSQRKIAAELGCSQQAIGKRQVRLEVKALDPRGGVREFDNQVVKDEQREIIERFEPGVPALRVVRDPDVERNPESAVAAQLLTFMCQAEGLSVQPGDLDDINEIQMKALPGYLAETKRVVRELEEELDRYERRTA